MEVSRREPCPVAEIDTKIAAQVADERRRAPVCSAMSRLAELSSHLKSQRNDPDWSSRREIIRSLVQRTEIGPTKVAVVFRLAADADARALLPDNGDIVPSVNAPVRGRSSSRAVPFWTWQGSACWRTRTRPACNRMEVSLIQTKQGSCWVTLWANRCRRSQRVVLVQNLKTDWWSAGKSGLAKRNRFFAKGSVLTVCRSIHRKTEIVWGSHLIAKDGRDSLAPGDSRGSRASSFISAESARLRMCSFARTFTVG
jgi:hypothetical protein